MKPEEVRMDELYPIVNEVCGNPYRDDVEDYIFAFISELGKSGFKIVRMPEVEE